MVENFDFLDEFFVKFFGDVFEKIYVEYNIILVLKYILIVIVKEVFFKFSKFNEDDSQGVVVSLSIFLGLKKYKNILCVVLNMYVFYYWLIKVFVLELGIIFIIIIVEIM